MTTAHLPRTATTTTPLATSMTSVVMESVPAKRVTKTHTGVRHVQVSRCFLRTIQLRVLSTIRWYLITVALASSFT